MISSGAERAGRRWSRRLAVLLLPLAVALPPGTADAEYADVVLNRLSEAADMAPVIFPHWFHRVRFRCKVCHSDSELGFKMRVGANPMDMQRLQEGEYCGACHNGQIAWGLENCELCHSGKMGLPTHIKGGHETSGPGRW
ncbi:c(7)-type cytochrome triheme domain-containing protein [Halomonas sp. DQ26W]|uniref:c(7)-type cytochrome triheme domain-containing protein n=1 Tax=Halomonas sp. DQ26W TaxID=2282311 RepID=UPI001C69EC01|nr:c(7)-type cytochrome triheme domain-containing protein [Halomonas sp. DQ26W]